MVAPGAQKGFIKTIDVFVYTDTNRFADMQQKDAISNWQQSLEIKLTERSLASMPFRVFIYSE